MNVQCRHGRTRIGRWFICWTMTLAFMVFIATLWLIPNTPVQAANQAEAVEAWIEQVLKGMFKRGQAPEPALKPAPLPSMPGVLRLTLEEAMALFLKQNLDLIIASYGIDAAKGQQITAQMFPNPTLSVNTFRALPGFPWVG